MKNFELKDTNFKARNSMYVKFYFKNPQTVDRSLVADYLLFYS